MSKAYITPNIISWARNRAHISVEYLAKKLHVSSATIQEWEKGDCIPTLNQAEKVANILHIPFGYLFLKTPPKEELPIPDLRIGYNGDIHMLSVDLIDVINAVKRRQDAYKEIMLNEDIQPLSFIGSFINIEDPISIAKDMQKIMKIDRIFIKKLKSWSDYLNYLTNNAEDAGILVFRNGTVNGNSTRILSTDEFRGFSLCDDIAPVLFINATDYKSSQIFTFAHELAHLWIGQSGISNIPPDELEFGIANKKEELCDKIAVEFLVPAEEFLSEWRRSVKLEDEIQRLARLFRVSSFVILRRSFEYDLVSQSEFYKMLEYLRYNINVSEHEKKPKAKGGNFYDTFRVRNGKRFTNAIFEALIDGSILYREAASLLDVHVSTLKKIAHRYALVG